jgi:hypothetical protein
VKKNYDLLWKKNSVAMRNMWWHFRFLFGQTVFLNCLTECQTSCLGFSLFLP